MSDHWEIIHNFKQFCKYSARDRPVFPQENRALIRDIKSNIQAGVWESGADALYETFRYHRVAAVVDMILRQTIVSDTLRDRKI